MSAEDRYRALLLHAPDPILTVDRDARVIAANLVACTVLGATESALMRTQILSRVPESEQRDAAKLLMRGFNGRSAEERITVVCDKGVHRRFLMRVIPIPQRGGTPIVTLLMRDVTDADQVAERGRRAVHLERTPGQFMLTLDLSARIVHAVGLDATLGHPDASWEGVDARDLLEYGPQRDEVFANVETDLSEVGSWASVQRCVRSDGSRVSVRLFATPRLDPDTREPIGCYMSGLVIVPRSATPAGAPVVSAERVAPREARRVPAGALPVVAPDAPPSVLVVDDDASMRSIVRRFLERAGYTVVEGVSGRNALGLLRDGAAVHFVVTDLKMPDGSGGWFMAQLGYEFPKLLPRTIVISGDAEGAGAAHVSARWRCPVLAKPFTASQLVNTLVRLASGAEEVA
jgi:two-component system chemotaxis response regulator CheY